MVEEFEAHGGENTTHAGCAKKKLNRKGLVNVRTAHSGQDFTHVVAVKEKKKLEDWRMIKNCGYVGFARQIRSEWKLESRGGWFSETSTAASPAPLSGVDQSACCPRAASSAGSCG